MNVTQSDILDAIRQATMQQPTENNNAITVDGLRAATGWGCTRCRAAIKKMLADGTMELTHIQTRAMDGSLRTVPAYRLK